MEGDRMLRDFFLGFIRIHILHHAAQGPVFGVQLMAELARHGYNLSAGTLYPVLHRMETDGYLAREDQVVNGKVRKYYRATPRGKEALSRASAKIAELVEEVLEESPNPSTAAPRE